MITIHPLALAHFKHLLEQQAIEGLGIRMRVTKAGTPGADCQLEFCEPQDLLGDEWSADYGGFCVYVDAQSAAFLTDAEIDYQKNSQGGQLTIKAPHIKGHAPSADAPLLERVRYVIDTEINPGLAAHGGRCQLLAIDEQGYAVLQFGGGCHGCGMVETTVREGIEKTLRARFSEVTGVRDTTDHAAGTQPYIQR